MDLIKKTTETNLKKKLKELKGFNNKHLCIKKKKKKRRVKNQKIIVTENNCN